uniref:Leukocyte immunoglobulin-like receptor subfamily A member 6 n=1 Tax=Gopherus evgoodei TaxID=1825980 RepID=A0A8C4YI86_9SAUR
SIGHSSQKCSDYARVCLTACLLLTAELSYPKPSISLSPHGEVVLGGTVIIRCECRCQNVTVLMYKLGNPDVRRWAETAGGVAEFTIDNVSWRDTGSYSCQYGTESDPPVWSHPSDPVELMVAGEEPAQYLCSVTGFPGWVCGTAGLSVPPTWGFPRNCDADVKLQTLAEFPITSVGRGDGGSYTCQYHTTSQTPDWSEPSDPMQLVVAGEGPSSASPLPAPQPAGHSAGLGPIGTLRARLCPKSSREEAHRGTPLPSQSWGKNPAVLAPSPAVLNPIL